MFLYLKEIEAYHRSLLLKFLLHLLTLQSIILTFRIKMVLRASYLLSLCFCLLAVVGMGQTYEIEWEKTFGTDKDDRLFGIIPVPNQNRYILYGYSEGGASFDRTDFNRGSADIWLLCIDERGNKIWDKAYGSTDLDQIINMCLAPDGSGFVLVGYTCGNNPNNEVSQLGKGGCDFWVIKIDFNGNKIWDRRYGGTNPDEGLSIAPTPDKGYIVAGTTRSGLGGDITTPNFNPGVNNQMPEFSDVWVIKIDSNGNLIWEMRLGGDKSDGMFLDGSTNVFAITPSKGDIWLSFSSNSDKSGTINNPTRGDFDWLLYKLDDSGNILNQWRYGGNRRYIYIIS